MRAIDADAVCERCRKSGAICTGSDCEIPTMPTLTQPSEGATDTNVGGKDKNVPTNEPLTLDELRLMVEPTPVWWDWVQGWVLARKGMIMSWNGRYHNSGELRGDFYRRPPEGEEET